MDAVINMIHCRHIMPTDHTVQYTIRGIPPEVDQALRRKAHDRRISLNRLLVEELIEVTGFTGERKYRSLEGLAGSWSDDPELDSILEEQRQIDWSLWK